jgi:cytosine deaminase
MDALNNAGRLTAQQYQRAILYSTLSPCDMCSGTALLYKIPKIVIGENQTFQGPEKYLRERGIQLEVINDPDLIKMMSKFIEENKKLWHEDIGEP